MKIKMSFVVKYVSPLYLIILKIKNNINKDKHREITVG